MSLSRSPRSFDDCYEIMDRALDDEKGARFAVKDISQAMYTRMRLHHARSLDRVTNLTAHPEGHAMHGCSVYDELVVRIREDRQGQIFVYLERMKVDWSRVDVLSEIDEETRPALPKVELRQLPPPEMRVVEGLQTGFVIRRRV